MKIAVIIPAYNEAKSLPAILKHMPKEIHGVGELVVVVVNDGSSDSTAKVALKYGAILLNHVINRGQGAALQTGFRYAKENNYDAVVTFDADGQHSVDEIQDIILPIVNGKYDVSLGCRFLHKVPKNMPLTRRLALRGGVVFTRIVSRVNVNDTHNGFRALGRNALSAISLIHDKMEHASELIDQIGKYKLKYCEVPVTINYSDYSKAKGQKSLNALKIAASIIFYKIVR